MKKQSRNTRGPGAWVLGSVASLLMCVSAFGQLVSTQSTPISIPDSGTGSPYPSKIDLTTSNISGTIEKVSVTVNGLTHPSAPDLGFLLVGPGNKAVVLLSGSGASSSGNAPLNNATFTFSDDASGSAPANSPLTSGSSYKPTDNAGLSFLPPAPTSGYVTTLGSAFGGGNPNGLWSLYVLDTTAGPGGGPSPVLSSWSLNLNTTPSFTIVTNASTVESATHQLTTTVPENGSVGVNLVLQSSSTPLSSLTVSAEKIPNLVTNFSTSGSDQNRTLTISPNANTFGTNTLKIIVSDGIGSATNVVTLAVTHTNQAPTIALSTNTMTAVSGFMSTNIIIATVSDVDINFDPASIANLNLTATSSDPSVVSSNGVFFGPFTAGGDKRTVTVIPNGTGTGTATVTVKVDDGALTNSASFTVTVLPVSYKIFANSTNISVAVNSSSNSTIVIPANTISGLLGTASIFVNGWKNVTPASTTFTLTPPGGTPIPLFQNSGPGSAHNYGQVLFVDGATGTLPTLDDVTNTISLAPPSQLGGTNGDLSGVNPNGTWTLTVQNNGPVAAQILDGWTLNLFAAPTVGNIAKVRAAEESTSTVNFTVGSINGSVTNVLGRIPSNPGLAKITGSVNGNNGSLTIVGNFNQFGTNLVEVVAQDNNGFYGTNTFPLELFFVDHPPTVDVIQRQVVSAGGHLGPIPVTVRDVDIFTPITSVTVRANSSDQKFLPDANILLQPAGTGTATSSNYTLTLFPVGAISGNVNVTITANDGTLNGTTTFNLFIQVPGNPLFPSPNAITVNANGPASPYGSTNNVSGLVGKVQKVSVSLFGVNVPTPGNAKFLLVGPTGASVLLMSGSGGNNGLTNTVLVFDADSSASLPSSGQIISGVYKPTQNGSTSLPPPAPASPYGVDFSGFNNTNPNGNWALYVADSGSAKGGIISGGWQLSIETAPLIPAIADQSTPENVTARINITVGDNQPGVGLNVVATGDPALFVAPIAVSGSGATRTLTIVPVAFKVGTNVITVTATDTNTLKTSTQTFNMAVQAVPQPPVFSTVPADQTVNAATQLPPVSFRVWPPQGSPLTVTASSTDNPTLIPSVDVTLTTTSNGTNVYSLTLIPAGVLTGTANIAIVATDTNGLKSTANFKVTVTPTLAFANTNTIIIPEGLPAVGLATPYPSIVSVKGLGGLISEAKVTLVGFTHPHPEDVDILLVSPDRSQSVILMGKAGAGGPVSDLRLNFADGAPAIPATGPLVDGTYSAADYSSGLTLPSPATERPYTTTLSDFNGLSPNGDWQLYVLDDTFPSGGSIANGWILSVKTAPAIAPINDVTTSENTKVILPVLLSDATVNETNLVVTVDDSLESVPDLATNHVLTGTGANRTLTITPTTNLPSAYNAQHSLTNLAGTNVITITATDPINHLTTVSSFVLTVLYVNQSPTVTTATNGVYIDENTTNSINYTVGDVDSIMDRSNIVVTSSDQSLLANSNIVVTGSATAAGATGTINVKVIPTKNTHGSLTLSFVASDTNTFTTNLVTLNINHIWQQPTISTIPAESAVAGSSTTNIAFTVGSVEVSTKNLLVFGKSDNTALVPNSPANIVFSGSGDSRFIQLFTIGTASGTAHITVFVTDNSGNANSTNSTVFTLTATSVANAFANITTITTTGVGKANLYPSPIAVSGLLGATYKVSVTLPNFSHSSPANLDVLLVERGDDNKTNAVVLMSGVGGTNAASSLRLTFDDSGIPLPSDSLTSATYLPGNATGLKLVLPAPAPTNAIWSTTLTSAFSGHSPNGTWELYVNDRGVGDVGNIANGWQLVLQTAPTIALHSGTPSPLIFPENTTKQVTLDIADNAIDISNLVVSATSDNAILLPVRNITFSPNPVGLSGSVTATLAPASLQSGSALVTFIVTRSDGASSSVKLPINVTPVNVPATVSRLDPISMPENGTSNVVFLVHDDDTPLGNLIVQATSGAADQGLIPNANLTFNGLNTNRLVGLPSSGAPGTSLLTLTVTPKLFQAGTATITITVTDPAAAGTNTITTNFTVTVNAVIFPPFFISAPGPQSVAAGGTIANIPFAVAHPVDAASTLTMSGTSSDQNLVKNADIVFNGTGTNRTVTITSQGNTSGGTANITLKVTDPATANNFATTNFALTVRPSRTHNYTNSTIINIIDNAVADLYPSQININNLGGPIAKVTATLNGFTHTFPSDVGILLVGPTGQKIVLMSNVGGGHPGATNLFLTFDQAAAGTIPANGPIVGGSFMPLDGGGSRTFQSPAPGTPYTNTLNAFNGTNPNGTWSLYVEDFSPPDAGAISNGWSLAITTLPVINGLTDITVDENTAARQNFTVSDDTPSTPTFTFSAASDNQSVVTNAGVVFTGSGTNWTVTVNPVVNRSGSANITVTMVNGDGQTVTSKFKATFNPVNYPPDLFPIGNVSMSAGTAASVPLIYGNIGYSQDQLTVLFNSSDTNLVPVGNMKLSGTNLLISPVGVQQGTASITVTVSNTNTPPQSTNQTFKLTVLPNPLPVFAASGTIVINDNAAATPYPSTIHVSGVATNIAGVTVTLAGFGHQFPSDVSALLVGPQGQKVVLMSRAGGSAAVSDTRLTFDDSAAAALPQFALITDGTYKPTDYKVSDTFFSPAPLAPYSHALNIFNGSNPNGDWQLFVQDDQPQEDGVITGGWVLALTTSGPTISNPGDTLIAENSVSNIINFSVSSPTVNASNLIVTAANTADNPKGLISNLTLGGSGSSRFIVVTPAPNLPSTVTTNDGSSTITLTVTDGAVTNSAQFTLTVGYANQPPTFNPAILQDLTTPANVPISTSFSLADVDSNVSNLVVSATTTIPGLGTATVSTVGSNSTVAYAPKGFLGTNIVKITVQDGGNTISNGFVVVTTASLPPTLGAIAPQSTPVNSNKSVTLNVSPATGIPGFTFSGSTTNHALVSSVTFTTNANSVVANLNVVPAMVGFDFVTITVSDKNTNSTQSFALTVTPTGVVTLAPILPVSTPHDSTPKVVLTASSPDTAVNNLRFTGSSTNSSLVSGFSFAYNGRNMIATINLVPNRGGKDFVTISTTDGFSTASQSFVLTVSFPPGGQTPVLTLSSSGGKLTLNLSGAPNTAYTIQSVTSLNLPITWGTLTNLTADANGNASFTATPSPTVPVQFIRAKSP